MRGWKQSYLPSDPATVSSDSTTVTVDSTGYTDVGDVYVYYYAMYDFDGSTGFDIPSRLTKYDLEYLTNIASHVYKQWKGSTTPEQRRRALNANTKGFR